ncbi:penicillin-binding transpeptidase domain-containing protein [Halalkalibacter kiskunsagensis]|uniref:serine-type D-Ala-D-Ala carboxypeptidase n=1 Tax=Halalkalibacter kiskunsagensis TaxID=1548599 RepID=A0ABV6KA58_9BACI
MMQKRTLLLAILVMIFIVVGCSEQVPTPEETFQEFATLWEQGEYQAMYSFLSVESKDRILEEEFVELYSYTYSEIELTSISINLIAQESEQIEEEVRTEVSMPFENKMDMFTGEFVFESFVPLKLDEEDNNWKIEWSPSIIFPVLDYGDTISMRILYPENRGEIFDRNGEQLAVNGFAYEIAIVPVRMEGQEEESIRALAKEIDLSEESIHNSLKQSWVGPDTLVPLKKVPLSKRSFVERLHETIPGATYRQIPAREYPLGEAAAHLTGYMGMITAEELEEDSEKVYHANSTVGRTGLEKLLETRLRGEIGSVIVTESADGQEKDIIAKKDPRDGESYQLTIDSNLQKSIYNQLNEADDAGTGVALNPVTGEVLSLVSSPAYDPNEFILGISNKKYETLNNDEKRPLTNRFTQSFTPGSTIKPITAAVALSNGLDPNKRLESSDLGWRKDSTWGDYRVRRVSNPLKELNLSEAMMYSDNIYFAQVAVDMGREVFEEGFKKFGFGENIPFVFGLTPSSIAKESIPNEIQLADTGYGQGELSVNPLHLSLLYSAFVANGSIPKPLLLLDEEPEYLLENVVSEEHSQTILKTLLEVVENATATAVNFNHVRLAGKTGTTEHKLSQEDEGEETGWFVAMNTDDPELLVLMMIENVEDRNGSRYVVQKVKNVFKGHFTN